MLAHDFGNGVVLVWLLRLLCMTMLGLLLWLENCEIFRKNCKFFTHPTRNRQFGWGALAHSVVQ